MIQALPKPLTFDNSEPRRREECIEEFEDEMWSDLKKFLQHNLNPLSNSR